jgi:D-amino peptidase
MHVAVFADIEGSFGIWRMRQCRMGTREWQYGRSCLTDDVNQAIRGAFDGGAKRVTVKDVHETGFNCLINRLDRRARYVGGHFINPTFFGDVQNYDLILYVAIHAASGTADAFFPHTHYGIFSEVRINEKPVCEMDVYGGYLGEFGVPIGLVSGEDIAVSQALSVLPWAKPVVVDKREETYTSGAKSVEYLSEGREKLRAAAAEAVRHASDMKPLVLSGPLHFDVTFRTEKMADKYNTWDFDQEGNVVTWDADTMIEGFEKLNKITFFPKSIYPVRRQVMFCMRVFYRLKNTYFAPKPNSEGAAVKG